MSILLITGASRGIGAATARIAAKRGYAVVVNYHTRRDAADAVAREITDGGGTALVVQADVGREADVLRMYETVDRELGTVTGLVNNTGIIDAQMRFDAMSVERWQRVLTTNVVGSFLCAREAVKRMSTRHGGRGGSIVNVSSVAAKIGGAFEYVDYAASKGAMDVMTVGLAREVATEGVRVNAVRPGPVYTDIHASGGEPDRVERVKAAVPMQRGGNVDEIAYAILWLLSDEASYVTGTIVDVSGGR